MKIDNNLDIDFIGDNHIGTSSDTPLRKDAFEMSDDDKIESIQNDVERILNTLGLDLTDDSLRGTPKRVGKMFVNEIFSGLNPKNKPNAASSRGHTLWFKTLIPLKRSSTELKLITIDFINILLIFLTEKSIL